MRPLATRAWPYLLAASLFAASCTGAGAVLPSPRSSSRAPSNVPSGGPPRLVSAQHNPLCFYPRPAKAPPPTPTPLPAPFQKVADQVQQIRGLDFSHPIVPDAVSQQQLNGSIVKLAAQGLPKKLVDNEAKAWTTIGVLPKGTDLRAVLLKFYNTQILGYYDNDTHRLVFAGTTSPTPYQRFVLSHELTHALDDQRLHFGRLADRLSATCQDERAAAFQAVIEGNAVATSVAWARRFLTPAELVTLNREASNSPPPTGIPRFVLGQEAFPYTAGPEFVHALQASGGERAVNAAFRNPPVSTEQILHPSLYPNDMPVPVVVPDLSKKLGPGWHLIDQLQPGEDWLQLMLELDLPKARADGDAAGWGGAEYRAWSDGPQTVVLMRTVWDSQARAIAFANAMADWLPKAGTVGRTVQRGRGVTVFFASSKPELIRFMGVAPI